MRQNIHPDYQKVLFYDTSAKTGFLVNSTAKPSEQMQWHDGNTYPVFYLETSSASHPFYTGQQAITRSEGRIARFEQRFGKRGK